MGGRGNVFVDHGVRASATVVCIPHLFTDAVPEPVGSPGFTLGNVVVQGRIQWPEAASVSLGPGLYSPFPAPLVESHGVAFVHEFHPRDLEIVPGPLDKVLELLSFASAELVVADISEPAHLEHDEWEPGHDVVAPALEELLSKIGSPVAAFEFHVVHE